MSVFNTSSSAKKIALSLVLSGTAVLPVHAQTKAADSVGLDEVIVTASRVEENLQKTALTVSAITGENLVEQGVTSVTDLGAQVPALQVTGGGNGAAQIFLRGVGSTNTTEVGDPAVAFHMDGVYIARATSVGSLFYDVARVEVVRGPQGTLYGRNATVGAINVISNKPSRVLEGSGAIEFGNYSLMTTTGMLNVPVSDNWAVRGAFQSTRRNGYQAAIAPPGSSERGVAVGNNRYDQDDTSGRVHVLFEPSEDFSLRVSGDYLHQSGAGGGDVAYNTATPALFPGPYAAFSDEKIFRNNKFWSIGSELNWKLGAATLTYLGSYNVSKQDRIGENPANHNPNYFWGLDKTWQHELRLSGNTGPIKWIGGLYYFSEDNNVDFRVFTGTNTYLSFIQPQVDAKSKAAFGQATWSVTDAFRVTAGARYNKDEKARNGGNYFTNSAGQVTSTLTVNKAAKSWSHFDWKLGIDYDLAPNSMLYATASTSYKAGGYFDGDSAVADNTYKPEEILAFEVGVKNRFWDDRLQVNADVFQYDYKDFQVSAVGTIAGQNATVTLNADKAKIYGLEVEAIAALTEADRIDGSLGWLHARYTSFYLPLGDAFANNNANANINRCYAANYAQAAPRAADFSGCKMARSPDWTINLGYEHVFTFGSGATLTPRLQTHYESEKNLEFHGFDENKQKSFTKTDFILTYGSDDAKWSVLGYVRNLEDKAVRTNSAPNSGTGFTTNGNTDFYAPPRTYGVRLSAKF